MFDDSVATLESPPEPWLKVTCSPGFTAWMAEQSVSLACTTYQSGKLMLFGRKPDGNLSVFERNFKRSMGLWGDGQTLWMSSQSQVWRIENLLRPGTWYKGHDRLFIPKIGVTTGDLDIHDIAMEENGRLVFAATGFNCLGTVDGRYSFTPLWRPSFVTEWAAEDRCHLNGLAIEDGRCRYVTTVAATDEAGLWRHHRRDGGLVLEVPSSEVVASGLSMPHSPRIHRGELWVLNSGTASWARSTDDTAGSSRSRSVPVISAAWPSSASNTPSSRFRSRAMTTPSATSNSTTISIGTPSRRGAVSS